MGEFLLFIYFVIFQINLGNTLRENRGQPIEVESAEKTKKKKEIKNPETNNNKGRQQGPNWVVTSGRRHTGAAARGNYFQVPFFLGLFLDFCFSSKQKTPQR